MMIYVTRTVRGREVFSLEASRVPIHEVNLFNSFRFKWDTLTSAHVEKAFAAFYPELEADRIRRRIDLRVEMEKNFFGDKVLRLLLVAGRTKLQRFAKMIREDPDLEFRVNRLRLLISDASFRISLPTFEPEETIRRFVPHCVELRGFLSEEAADALQTSGAFAKLRNVLYFQRQSDAVYTKMLLSDYFDRA
jgi:hypothetical protein